jgi:subtilisin-like proprotein convertase family protein
MGMMQLKLTFFAFIFASQNTLANSPMSKLDRLPRAPKIIVKPASHKINSLDDIYNYLKKNHKTFGFGNKLENIIFVRSSESLRGVHYYFQQTANNLIVKDAELIISVSNLDAQIYNIYNNITSTTMPKISKHIITLEQAQDIAWQNLRVHGSLLLSTATSLEYRLVNNNFRLIYVVNISSEAPFGYFEHIIDAHNGAILANYNTVIERTKQNKWLRDIENYQDPIWDRNREEQKIKLKLQAKVADNFINNLNAIEGRALVFDPDPRTALADRSLEHDSPPEKFEAAYCSRPLKDLRFSNNEYRLEGPWVTITDIEAPHTAPSKSSDGNWTAKRGNNAFNDVMTYFHIDQSQRYIQSLGFFGARGIQFGSIKADSDGLGGDDNSHYVPSDNHLAFGHGCVGDNEDADVILHEYAHALHHSINHNWHGGDTGAMGEGFGDYWAASYSISTPNGVSFYPHEIFTWDAHGNTNSCWAGRVLNALNARYDPNTRYTAHSPIPGGFQSDELWSTPLFQSLLSLVAQGIAREEVDRIILESHFGLGADISMRQMAQQIITTARALFPAGPHANVFEEKFAHHHIIELPRADLVARPLIIANAGTNNYPDPGENISLYVPLFNKGTLLAPEVHAVLSSLTPGIEILQANTTYYNIAANEQQSHEQAFTLALDSSLLCNTVINLNLSLNSSPNILKENNINIALELGSPWPNPNIFSTNTEQVIPDGDLQGIQSSIIIAHSEALIKASDLKIEIDINHSFRGDLQVTLISPQGTRVLLHNNSGNNEDNLIGTYPLTLTPVEPFTKLEQEPLDGEWKLEVIDSARMDNGILKSWSIHANFERRCEL